MRPMCLPCLPYCPLLRCPLWCGWLPGVDASGGDAPGSDVPGAVLRGDIRTADGTLLVKSMNISLCFGLTSQIKFASIRY